MPNPPAQKRLLSYAISAFLLGTGALGLTMPQALALLFGQSVAPGSSAYAFVQCMASRNFSLGIAVAECTRRGNWHAVSTLAGVLALDGCVDAWVTYRQAGWMWAAPHALGGLGIPFVARWLGN